MNASRVCTDVPSVGNGAKMAENVAESIRERQMKLQSQNSASMPEIKRPNMLYNGKGSAQTMLNVPIAVLRGCIIFGQAEDAEERVAASIEDEMAGDGDRRNGMMNEVVTWTAQRAAMAFIQRKKK